MRKMICAVLVEYRIVEYTQLAIMNTLNMNPLVFWGYNLAEATCS